MILTKNYPASIHDMTWPVTGEKKAMTYSVTQKASYKEKKISCIQNSWFCSACNGLFAQSSHMVQNRIRWWASCALELPKQYNSYQSTWTCICFGILYHVTRSGKETIVKKSHAYNNNPPLPLSKLHGPSLWSVDSMAIKVTCCRTKILNKW